MSDFQFFARLIGAVVLGLAALLALAGVAGYVVDSTSCGNLSGQIQRDAKYSIWTGCYVQVGDQWVPDQNWRAFEEPR